jgi:hypothetical protein
MTNPITPPPELVQQWRNQAPEGRGSQIREMWIATRAAQWGADQELEACCEWLQVRINEGWNPCHLEDLRTARRPKPPSLKEQSLALIDLIQGNKKAWDISDLDVVRRALEQLDD